MAKGRVYNLGSLNIGVNPLLIKEGDLIRSLNVETDVAGALKKREGYGTHLASLGGEVTSLFNFTKNNGTEFWNYVIAGGSIFYSTQGTGAWTICGNGTLTNGARPVPTVLEETLILGDGTLATRHTTSGTDFTDTTAAPKARFFQEYQQRIWAGGTASSLFFSNVGTPTDWTNDSSSINIPGAGRIESVFKSNDRLITTKNSGAIFRYDGDFLVDMATDLGPTSAYSVGTVEDYRFWLNRVGIFGYGGNKPEIISNPVRKLIYNDKGNGIQGTTFDNAMGVVHNYDYLLSIGTVTDDLTDEEISDAILRYDFQLDQHHVWKFADRPTAWLSFKDENGNRQLIFSDSNGQCYKYGNRETTDNTSSIEAVMEFVIHANQPELDKEWNYLWFFFNPGCQAKVQVAAANTYTKDKKKWIDLGDSSDGVVEFKGSGLRSKLLFVKIYESSRNARFHFYGFSYDYRPVGRS